MKMKLSVKIAICAMLSACATIAFIIESLFPPIFLPGARMGISNFFILLCLIVLGAKYSFAVLIVKVLLGSLFSGNVSSLMYSLPAGLISLSAQTLLLYLTKNVSLVAVSVFGATANITIQNITFCIITKTTEYLSFLPYLSLVGAISGLIIGYATFLVAKKIPARTE